LKLFELIRYELWTGNLSTFSDLPAEMPLLLPNYQLARGVCPRITASVSVSCDVCFDGRNRLAFRGLCSSTVRTMPFLTEFYGFSPVAKTKIQDSLDCSLDRSQDATETEISGKSERFRPFRVEEMPHLPLKRDSYEQRERGCALLRDIFATKEQFACSLLIL